MSEDRDGKAWRAHVKAEVARHRKRHGNTCGGWGRQLPHQAAELTFVEGDGVLCVECVARLRSRTPSS